MGREITFRPATFYLGIADMLAGEVEGQPAISDTEGGEPSGVGTQLEGNEAGRGVDVAEDARGVDEPAETAEPPQPKPQRTTDETRPER